MFSIEHVISVCENVTFAYFTINFLMLFDGMICILNWIQPQCMCSFIKFSEKYKIQYRLTCM